MKRVVVAGVMALTVAFSSIAAANEGATAPSPPPPPPPSTEPLALRPSKPLTLAPEQSSSSWSIKAILGAVAIGAGFVAWRKRKQFGARGLARTDANEVRIVTRTSVGMRGEIAVVEAGAMRLVVGITPSSMTTLAVLGDDAENALEHESSARGEATPRRLLAEVLGEEQPQARRAGAQAAAARYLRAAATSEGSVPPAPKRSRRPPEAAPLEGQVRGLAFAMKKAR